MGTDRRGCGDRPGIVGVHGGRQQSVDRTPAWSAARPAEWSVAGVRMLTPGQRMRSRVRVVA